MYDSYAAEYPPWNPYDQPFPATYHQQHLPPATTSPPAPPHPHPRGHPRITLAGSLDPATGIFYRTPEHPRLRTAQACEKCRTRKAKCSGEHPACARCLARGLVCEYAREGRVRGPNKPKGRAHSSSHSSTHSTAPNAPNADPPVKRRRRNTALAAGSPVKLEPLSSCVPLALHPNPNPKRLSLPTMLGFDADGEYLRQLGGGGDYTSARDYLHGTRTSDYPLGDYPDYPHTQHTSSAAYDYPYPDSPSSPTAHTLHPTLHHAPPQLHLDLRHHLHAPRALHHPQAQREYALPHHHQLYEHHIPSSHQQHEHLPPHLSHHQHHQNQNALDADADSPVYAPYSRAGFYTPPPPPGHYPSPPSYTDPRDDAAPAVQGGQPDTHSAANGGDAQAHFDAHTSTNFDAHSSRTGVDANTSISTNARPASDDGSSTSTGTGSSGGTTSDGESLPPSPEYASPGFALGRAEYDLGAPGDLRDDDLGNARCKHESEDLTMIAPRAHIDDLGVRCKHEEDADDADRTPQGKHKTASRIRMRGILRTPPSSARHNQNYTPPSHRVPISISIPGLGGGGYRSPGSAMSPVSGVEPSPIEGGGGYAASPVGRFGMGQHTLGGGGRHARSQSQSSVLSHSSALSHSHSQHPSPIGGMSQHASPVGGLSQHASPVMGFGMVSMGMDAGGYEGGGARYAESAVRDPGAGYAPSSGTNGNGNASAAYTDPSASNGGGASFNANGGGAPYSNSGAASFRYTPCVYDALGNAMDVDEGAGADALGMLGGLGLGDGSGVVPGRSVGAGMGGGGGATATGVTAPGGGGGGTLRGWQAPSCMPLGSGSPGAIAAPRMVGVGAGAGMSDGY
ncbi:hypothetical protein C8J57DRAFT_1719101 [Mycena rebaudengoi]|nr:hypothetical protein C8J57DRAFT_1719101 [Mycena rebaudengoi]